MIKVNLISKKSRAYSGKNWTKIVSFSSFGLFSLYFIGVTLYVLISLFLTSNKIKKIDVESQEISSVMLKNNERLSRFVLTKLILTEIQNINKNKFNYKEYLDQITLLLPSNTKLNGIDFKVKGWLSLSINATDVISFQALEKVLLNKNTWKDSKLFSGAYIESVSKDKSGSYNTKLQIELKGNG